MSSEREQADMNRPRVAPPSTDEDRHRSSPASIFKNQESGPMRLFVVGKGLDDGWGVVGIYATAEQAERECFGDDYWVGPMDLNETVHEERDGWPGAYHPTIEKKLNGERVPRSGLDGCICVDCGKALVERRKAYRKVAKERRTV